MHFDELHIISDLHLGGETGFQIFGSTPELELLIKALGNEPNVKNLALCINGDFIDFLAEKPSTYFDPHAAGAKLARIIGDAAFKPIFDALAKFVRTPQRTLIINLGNHDLELALPWVREALVEALCGDDLAARGRLRLITDGTGVRCQVGNAQVLCVHGNEVDSWNVADYEQIRRIGRDIGFGKPVEPWIPNAGTQMVIQVMNDVKRQFPFVDLLKPEAEAVVPTLLALDPSSLAKLRGAAATAGRRAWDAARMATGFLGDVQMAPADRRATGGFSLNLPGPDTREAAQEQAAELMRLAEEQNRRGTEPIDLVRGDQTKQLGFWSAAWNLATGKPVHEVLRVALDKLDCDRSFAFDTPDDTFRWLDDLTGPDIDFLVAGHTHLERALTRRRGRGYYLNSGTWARLIQITPETRGNATKFERLFNLLKGGQMTALDAEPDLVTKRATVVSIFIDAQRHTCGELRHMNAGAAQPSVVKGSQLIKK